MTSKDAIKGVIRMTETNISETQARDLAEELLTQLIKVNNFFKKNIPNEIMIVKFGEDDVRFIFSAEEGSK